MPSGTKEIQRRIRSVTNTKKITKAMELVSAAKMRRAVQAVLATRQYARTAWNIVQDLAAKTDPEQHQLLQTREKIQRIGMIMITSNRGLCGGFNRELVETAGNYASAQGVPVDVILMGKKGSTIQRQGHTIVADFDKLDVAESVRDVQAMARMVITDYLDGKYDKIAIAYTDYQSAIKQTPHIRQLLPIIKEDAELGQTEGAAEIATKQDFEYMFEPSPAAVLQAMLYRLTELQVYQALLESNASEHSARMFSMRNASDAATDMIKDLTLTFNQARQQSITSELAEISASRAAIT
ncbi:MAG: ATP synthase F1 subunit gamma [Candidatus Kerfeldbacteria bacterium]|nr:ATP synthase F1 subunit gamma [Candidatus Kerfeldbacteria bacterium]